MFVGHQSVSGVIPPTTQPPLELAEKSGMEVDRSKVSKIGGHWIFRSETFSLALQLKSFFLVYTYSGLHRCVCKASGPCFSRWSCVPLCVHWHTPQTLEGKGGCLPMVAHRTFLAARHQHFSSSTKPTL